MGEKASFVLSGIGLLAAAALSVIAPRLRGWGEGLESGVTHDHPRTVRFLAVGDINLGRFVGQRILAGDTLYPFEAVRDSFALYDLVFGNLESDISDQDGETEDPTNNMVFTAPPAAARSLARSGIRLVSTANNHALDYGDSAAGETREALRAAGIAFAGTASDTGSLFDPSVVSVNGSRFALFACTDLMNMPGAGWKTRVASTDTARLFPRIRNLRESVDFIIVSVHIGDEYGARATGRAVEFARSTVRAGADLVLGHHPHVPYGIEEMGGRMIVFSLGNFVFSQPARYWTRYSYAFSALIRKDPSGTSIGSWRCIPVRCGFQPAFLGEGTEADSVYDRVYMQSMMSLSENRP